MQQLVSSPSQQLAWPFHGLVSLLDMQKIFLSQFIALERVQSSIREALKLEADRAKEPRNRLLDTLRDPIDRATANSEFVRLIVTDLAFICESHELPARKWIRRHLQTLPQTDRELAMINDVIMDELGEHLFLSIPADRAGYWESRTLVSDTVKDRFKHSNVVSELKSAGTAYACDLSTACVMHAMRAAETGVRLIAEKVGVPNVTEDSEWANLLDQIISKTREIEKKPRYAEQKSDRQFYSEVALELGLMKDAWRIPAAHSKTTYSQPQALEVLRATCRFYEKAAERFSDSGAETEKPA